VLSDEDWQRILDVNLLAAVRLDRVARAVFLIPISTILRLSSLKRRPCLHSPPVLYPQSGRALAFRGGTDKGPQSSRAFCVARFVVRTGVTSLPLRLLDRFRTDTKTPSFEQYR